MGDEIRTTNRDRLIRAAQLALFIAGVFALSTFATVFSKGGAGVATFWPINTIGLVMMLRWTRSRADAAWLLAGIVAATTMANLFGGASVALAAGFGLINAMEVFLGSFLGRTFAGVKFTSVNQGWRFFAAAGPLPILIGASLAATLSNLAGQHSWWMNGFTWAVAEFLGFLLLGPLGMTLSVRAFQRVNIAARWFEALLVGLLIVVVSAVAFSQSAVPMLFMIMPFVLLATFRLGLLGANLAVLGVAAVAIPLSSMGLGPLSLVHSPVTEGHVFALQAFLAVTSLTAIPVASAVEQKNYLVARESKKSTELSLMNSELLRALRTSALAESTAISGHWSIDFPEMRFLVSEGLYRVFGLDPAEGPLSVEGTISMYQSQDQPMVRKVVADAVSGKHGFAFETVLERPNGQRANVRVVAQYFDFGDGRGSLLGVVQDITVEAQSRMALADSERRFRAIAETAGDLIICSDLKGLVTYASPACETVTGFPAESLVGTHGLHGMAQDDARAFRNQFIAQMTTAHDGEWRTAFRMTDPEGALRWLVASSRQLLSEDGQTLGAISIIRDETARMALEAELLAAKQEAERAADAKAEFLANMSHEIRTPLNCIIGFSSLIEEAEELKPETLRRARLVKEASHALLGVVNDILDISKIEVEGVPLNPTPTDLPELLAQTLSIFQEGASRKGVDYRLQTEGLTQPLMLDPARIRQLVFNLVGNAAKFTETGSITVRAEIVEADQLQIAIADTGVGIPAARIGKIFERFEQADNSTHRKYGGTGLGLPICRAIVEAMGGTITVESVEGQGSTFSIRVPLIKADQPLRPVPELVQPELEARPLRALLADDNAANRELFSAIMTGVGVDLVSVADGAQAVTAGTSETFDIIFMDVHMPVLDGLGATRQLRRLGVQTPIVALTADVLPRNLKDCVDAGMTGYLAKPYAPSDLIQTLFSSLA